MFFYSKYKKYGIKICSAKYAMDNSYSGQFRSKEVDLKYGSYRFDIYHKNRLVKCCQELIIKDYYSKFINILFPASPLVLHLNPIPLNNLLLLTLLNYLFVKVINNFLRFKK